MTRRAILHIGTEKTGTTTLQYTLARNTEALAGAGFRYPLLGAGNAHVALVYYAKMEGPLADLPALAGAAPSDSREAFDARIAAELAAEVTAHPEATFLFSTEHASSRLADLGSLMRLKALLDRHFDWVDVMVYLRRWDEMAAATYSTRVRNGETAAFNLARFAANPLLDYRGLLDRWGAAFGADRLHVGLYDRAELVGGSIVSDFAARFGLPPLAAAPDANTSFDAAGIATLLLVNRALATRPAAQAGRLRERIAKALPPARGAGAIVSRDEAAAFVARFADQAEAIRSQYFPDRATLFDDRYGEDATDPQRASWRDATDLLIEALARADREASEMTADVRARRAEAHLDRGDIAAARVEAETAIWFAPDEPRHRALLETVVARLAAS